jgi:peptidoglycan/xylan/chitin deacetylase (PgdA/CDA1 family)
VSAGFDVVVCCGHGVEPADECMEALRQSTSEAVRVVRADTGWEARQHATESSTADVLAFVDPDVVVPDDWLDSLRLAWETSPHSIGAIGGPILADAPTWAYGRLGLIDLGGSILELDPAERTLFAGNLSFWRRALVGVGGFGPPVDGRDATDWLSEEHEAERQLGHWGWLIRYEPAMAARRLIAAERPLRRAYRYGVRTGLAGSRPAGVAFRQSTKSTAGALAALARGRRAEARERAARAAENLGVLAAGGAGGISAKPHSQRGGLTPYTDVTFTSERGQAPPSESDFFAVGGQTPSPVSRSSPPPVDVVLLYHRFAAGEPDPLGLCVAPERFAAQLRVLRDGFEVVSLADVAARLRAGEAGSGRVAITIDDGYVDNLTTGIPLIAEAEMPATLFAATGHIETGRRFFWDEMQRLLRGPGARPERLEVHEHSWPTRTAEEREVARAELHRLVQPRALEEIDAVLEALRAWAGAEAGEPPEATRPVTIDELKQLAQTPQLEIGAHTRDHVNLAHRSADEIRAQVERSRHDVASWTGARPQAFSYPFGIPRHDVGEEAEAAVAEAGFEYAVVNQPIAVEEGDDPFAIPRVFAPDVDAADFAAWLRRLFD